MPHPLYCILYMNPECNVKGLSACLMVFNATFNNISVISWCSVLLMEKTGVPVENHQPVASHLHTLSHNVLSSTPPFEWDWNSQL